MVQLMHLALGSRYNAGYKEPVALPKHSCCTKTTTLWSLSSSLRSWSTLLFSKLLLLLLAAAAVILFVIKYAASRSASLFVIRPHWCAAKGSTPAPFNTTNCWVDAGATWIRSSSQARHICSLWNEPKICFKICGKQSRISPPMLKQGITWPLITVSSRLAEDMSREDMRGGGILFGESPPDTMAEDFRAVAAKGCSVSGRILMLKRNVNKSVSCLFTVIFKIQKAHLQSLLK